MNSNTGCSIVAVCRRRFDCIYNNGACTLDGQGCGCTIAGNLGKLASGSNRPCDRAVTGAAICDQGDGRIAISCTAYAGNTERRLFFRQNGKGHGLGADVVAFQRHGNRAAVGGSIRICTVGNRVISILDQRLAANHNFNNRLNSTAGVGIACIYAADTDIGFRYCLNGNFPTCSQRICTDNLIVFSTVSFFKRECRFCGIAADVCCGIADLGNGHTIGQSAVQSCGFDTAAVNSIFTGGNCPAHAGNIKLFLGNGNAADGTGFTAIGQFHGGLPHGQDTKGNICGHILGCSAGVCCSDSQFFEGEGISINVSCFCQCTACFDLFQNISRDSQRHSADDRIVISAFFGCELPIIRFGSGGQFTIRQFQSAGDRGITAGQHNRRNIRAVIQRTAVVSYITDIRSCLTACAGIGIRRIGIIGTACLGCGDGECTNAVDGHFTACIHGCSASRKPCHRAVAGSASCTEGEGVTVCNIIRRLTCNAECILCSLIHRKCHFRARCRHIIVAGESCGQRVFGITCIKTGYGKGQRGAAHNLRLGKLSIAIPDRYLIFSRSIQRECVACGSRHTGGSDTADGDDYRFTVGVFALVRLCSHGCAGLRYGHGHVHVACRGVVVTACEVCFVGLFAHIANADRARVWPYTAVKPVGGVTCACAMV